MLSMTINKYMEKQVYKLPIKQKRVELDVLLQEELAWIKKASSNDQAVYRHWSDVEFLR